MPLLVLPHLQVVLQTSQNGKRLRTFSYTGSSAWWAPGDERVHINFWMFHRVAPPRALELAVDCFWFCPAGVKSDKDCIGRRC
jgi:hypothetical protein